jgi:V/A-type H+-transporting ATPase subunit D
MARLAIAPTKSHLQTLRKQLGFAEEGYDLLEQKRQILVLELMRRAARVRALEERTCEALRQAHAAQREATLEIGTDALERAALATPRPHEVTVTRQHLMGLHLPESAAHVQPGGAPYGPVGTTLRTDQAMQAFLELLPLLGELAGLQNAVVRLAQELRRTQRRSNALSKLLIPSYRETIAYIASALEERERESLIILKMIRNRLVTCRRPAGS